MVKNYTNTEYVYECALANIRLHKESGVVTILPTASKTGKAEYIRELGTLLCDIATEMKNLSAKSEHKLW
jgi:hypothetical protein